MKFEIFKNNSFDIWREEISAHETIITRFKALDNYFNGGGINLCKITEFSGMSGTGKTQMCLQLCLNVQIPKSVGGLGGKALFIDTQQDFHIERLKELAAHLANRFMDKTPEFNVDSMLTNVHYVYCCSYATLMATILNLPKQFMKEQNFKLIVIDSLSFTLRMIPNVNERTTLLYELIHNLRALARRYNIAIVLTNEMTNRRCTNDKFKLVSALGDTHGHLINERIIFNCLGKNEFLAAAGKSMDNIYKIGKFEITRGGIKGCL